MTPPDAVDLPGLRRALAGLRLNRHYPPWRDLDAHLAALTVPAPHQPLRLSPGTAWPTGDAWMRVRVDHGLAEDVLAVQRPLAAAGNAQAKAQVRYLDALLTHRPLVQGPPVLRLVRHEGGRVHVELVWDLFLLQQPRFRRCTLRFAAMPGEHVVVDGLDVRGGPALQPLLSQALAASPARTWRILTDAFEPLDLCIGEVGPARPGLRGPWLSASLARLTAALDHTSVDDPLLLDATLAVPAATRPERLALHRKWAVPRGELSAARAWLKSKGSRNIVYGV